MISNTLNYINFKLKSNKKIGGNNMNRNIPMLLIMSFFAIAMVLSPVSATQHKYPVHCVYDDGSGGRAVTPYIDIGTGHLGTWKIWGWTQDCFGTHNYIDTGHVLPVISRYWGYKASAQFSAAFDSYADF